LTIARAAGRSGFSSADLAMAAGFANHASLAIELAAARADQQRVVLLEDRDRIARDLHDHVIQQLFAIGLSIEGVAATIDSHPDAAARLHERVADIDRTIRQIRTSIFELRGPLGGGEGLRAEILKIGSEVGVALGFAPAIAFAGQIDMALTGSLAEDVAACVREGLTNVAKHARATSATVDVEVGAGEVVVRVGDNGAGYSPGARASGIANLRQRAEHRHGSFELSASAAGGTDLIWRAPLT
jgi:signal transduction histidine kinase